ncbi:MAG: UvrD-helicase domain-containing protein, partial [Novosphingobium sp.]|nr:UvrD-helicase domain-containing protein [Novosphingobium sp.]
MNDSNNNSKNSFQDFFDNFLNKEQQNAISPKNGVLLVHAGAGSGKTRVITSRIASLIINHDVDPNQILALTFTNKAAKEMKERVSGFLKDNIKLPYVGTFHSYCLRLLKSSKYFNKIESTFTLIDQDDQNKIIKNLIKKNNLDKKITPKQISSFISKIKNECPNLEQSSEFILSNNIYKELYLAYEKEKKLSNCLDFDDLLIQAYILFKENSDFKSEFQRLKRHILIDEYQDTNQIQHLLLKSMALDQNSNFILDSLCAVGDEDQSIYSWRGATVFNMLNFKKDFKDTTTITLDQNYRSVQPILYTANNIIQNNKSRNIKNLWSDKKAQDRIRVVLYNSGYQEGNGICQFLKACAYIKSSNSNAILYRSHFQSRAIEESLIRHSIPYKIVGAIQFYDRLEIKDMIAYLRLIANPFDRPAFSRVINTPARNFGDKFQEQYMELWDEQPNLNFKEISNHIISNHLTTKIKEESLIKFLEIFSNFSTQNLSSKILQHIIYETNYYHYLEQNFDKDEALSKKENIKELINSAIFFEKNNNDFTLKEFLEEISLLQELISSNNGNNTQVYLMTFHAAKGLEFDNVIIAGVEEGILPSSHSTYSPDSLEEERRLMYVGITRARERLLITHSSQRIIYGQNSTQKASRFINELPSDYVKKEDCTQMPTNSFEHYFKQWLNNNPNIYNNKIN